MLPQCLLRDLARRGPAGSQLAPRPCGAWNTTRRTTTTGEVLPGGGDWIRVGNDRVARLDVRATLRTDDDELIFITTTGVCRLGDEGITRYWQGETVGWEEAYIRGSIGFQTGAERYAWLNATHTVAMMQLAQDHVDYRVFAVG